MLPRGSRRKCRDTQITASATQFADPLVYLLLVAIVILAQIAVVELPFLQSAFGTTSITAAHWALAVGAGAAVLAFEEVVKAIRRWV